MLYQTHQSVSNRASIITPQTQLTALVLSPQQEYDECNILGLILAGSFQASSGYVGRPLTLTFLSRHNSALEGVKGDGYLVTVRSGPGASGCRDCLSAFSIYCADSKPLRGDDISFGEVVTLDLCPFHPKRQRCMGYNLTDS